MKTPVIIIVDDEKIVLDSLKTELKSEMGDKYQIEVAEGGEEALELVEELIISGYDIPLIITDYIMPDIKGDDLLRRIHQQYPSIIKVMLTGQADLHAVGNAVNYANLYRFITKPWDKNDLILTVKEACRSYSQAIQLEIQNAEIRELNRTLEKKVEERTLQLLEANAAKDKFFSIIAHDLKNPLNVVLFSGEMLVTNFDNFSPEKIKDMTEKMYTGTKRISDLLLNLLEWSRSQTGSIPFHPEILNVSNLVNETISLLQYSAESKGINLYSEVSEDLFIFGDKNMLTTVIRNLINNALKFTNPEGSVYVTSESDEQDCIISINDNGVGIKAENIDKLFRIDQHHSTKGTSKETGTGLGLLLCKEFIQKNNGRIWVQSEENKGSSFKFSIPK